MLYNLAWVGPPDLFQYRRELLLFFKYGLEDLGEDVTITKNEVMPGATNLFFGAHFLPNIDILPHEGNILVNSEPLIGNTLNGSPEKTDVKRYKNFLTKLPVLDIIQHNDWGEEINSAYVKLGYCEPLIEIQPHATPTWNAYFFGLLTGPRREKLHSLNIPGLLIQANIDVLVRNSNIAASRYQLQLNGKPIYKHASGLRIAYLANNGLDTLAEPVQDDDGYLEFCKVAPIEEWPDLIASKWTTNSLDKFESEPYMCCNLKSFGGDGGP